jgi:hypothetical protein
MDFATGTDKPWRYLAMLKGREGEYAALSRLSPAVRPSVTPLILLRGGLKAGDDAAQLAEALDKMRTTMGQEGPILLDGTLVPDPQILGDCLEAARNKQWVGVPCLSLGQFARLGAVAREAATSGAGVAFRLEHADVATSEDLTERLGSALAELRVKPEGVDLIIDFEAISWMHLGALELAAINAVRALPWVGRWRHLAVSGSGMPKDLREFPADQISPIPRPEIALYAALYDRRRLLPRLPAYADYGVAHPTDVDDTADVKVLNMTASLRYTTAFELLVVKGLPVRSGGFERFPDLLRRLTQHPDFAGEGFSDGDRAIRRAADGSGPGMGSKWREWATGHHVTLVTRQIATQFAG